MFPGLLTKSLKGLLQGDLVNGALARVFVPPSDGTRYTREKRGLREHKLITSVYYNKTKIQRKKFGGNIR